MQRQAIDNVMSGLRILIAEDEILVALELEDLLMELECQVVDVVNHADRILRSAERADCALLDVNLKGETCYQAALHLKAQNVPFAFVTGYSELPECPVELGEVPRLGKPFNKELLGRLLGDLMAARRVKLS